jgi:hypothetical protein
MSTRAEQFRYEAERAGPKRAKAALAEAAAPRPTHNAGERAGRHAAYALEATAGRPSRRSTRKSAHHQKTDAQFRMKGRVADSRPRAGPR